MSFIQNFRTLVVGSANNLLNRAIDMNSPVMLQQNIRDLEQALDKMQNNAAVEAGALRTLKREAGDLESKISSSKAAVKVILNSSAPNKDAAARLRATEIVAWQKQLDEKNSRIVEQQQASQELDKAVSQLQARHDELVNRVRELERIDRDTKAKEQAANTVAYAGKIMQQGAGISVDDIESKMRARQDVANEKFGRALGTIQTEPDPTTAQDVDDLLAQLGGTNGKATAS